MSDPVKNAEVEDVLSSIRRLVSEDKRPLQAAKPAPATASAPAATVDRLVLTPALRVEEDVARRAESYLKRPSNAVENGADASDNQPTAEALQDEAGLPEVGEQDIADDYADDPYRFDDTDDLDGDGDIAVSSSVPSDETLESEELQSQDKSAALSAKIAALETAIGDISDEWEPDGLSDDANSGSEPPAMVWEDEDAGGDVEMDEDEVGEVRFSHRTEAIRDVMAEDTNAKSNVEETPQEQDDTLFQATTKPEVSSDTDVAVETDDVDAADSFEFAAEDQLLDEEALRDMVSEIVHSELQGALGERITRNVRRLVRREIHRALTARDLD